MTALPAPRLVIVGGPNGAGKTTLARAYAAEHGLRYLGADDIAAQMNPADPAAVRVAAARAFSRELRAVVTAGESLVVESTLSGGSLAAHIAGARRQGYAVSLVMVFLDSAELCLKRVRTRVAAGGHDVPEADVRRRFLRSLHRFEQVYRPLVDDWQVMFNGEAGHEMVAAGQGPAVALLFDEALWSLFCSLAQAAAPTENEHDDSD